MLRWRCGCAPPPHRRPPPGSVDAARPATSDTDAERGMLGLPALSPATSMPYSSRHSKRTPAPM
jgi:hypothetical protein